MTLGGLVTLLGCSSADTGTNTRTGGHSMGGTDTGARDVTDGSAGAASGGSGGSAGTAQADCGEVPAADGTSCSVQGLTCAYNHCPTEQNFTLCWNGVWQSSSAPCTEFSCGSETCTGEQICSVVSGAAQLSTCVENACGAGPITCECMAPSCPDCRISGRGFGFKVTCTSCPAGMQCP